MTKGLADRFPTSPTVVRNSGEGGDQNPTPPHPLWGVGGGGVAPVVAVGGGEVGTPHRLVSVDIGRTGALALFVGGILAEIADMPTLGDGPACRPTVNGPLLATLVRRWAPTEAVCEHVAARPGEAPSGAFAFGRSRGVIEGVFGAEAVPVRFITPAWWKRRAGVPPGIDMKDKARSIAIGRWPALAETFARVKDHDRAEAALIGLAYLEDRR